MNPLDRLADEPRWVPWRNEPRPNHKPGDKLTKIPYSPHGGRAKADDPTTWGTKAQALAFPLTRPDGGGIGIELGDLGGDVTLAGIDVDSCRNRDATFADWAKPILQELASTYTEISPSLIGVKSFFLVDTGDVRWFLDLIGVPQNGLGARRSIPGQDARDHGPAIEPFFGGKYFTVTAKSLTDPPSEVALFDRDTLSRLAKLIPPATGPGSGQKDRSAIAFGKGLAFCRKYPNCTYQDMVAALRADPDPDIVAWIREKGEIVNERQLKNIWDKREQRVIPPQPSVKSAGGTNLPPPRPWLLGTTFCRGFLSGLTGTGGVGKTALRILQFIALALGRSDLTGEHVFKRTRVLLVCLEDDENEIERRVWAACIHHKIVKSDLDSWLYYWTPKDLRLLEVDQFGKAKPGFLGDELYKIIKELDIGLISIDPFVKSHGADENDNNLIDQAATLLLQVGHDAGAAPDYVHHHKKGVTLSGDQDSSRGASSLANASRLVKTVTRMSVKEGEGFGLDEAEYKALVRLDDAKLNIAPPAETAMWFRLVGVNIGNPTEDYPHGDNVQTVERWYPPKPANKLTKPAIAEIFADIRNGPEPGEFYLLDIRASEEWAGEPIIRHTGMKKEEAKRLLRDWIKNGVLIESEYLSPRRKERRKRVTLSEVKAVEILGSYNAFR